MTAGGVLQLVEIGGKTTKVVNRLRGGRRHDGDVPGLPVRRYHQHRRDVRQLLAKGLQVGAEHAGFEGKGRRTMGDKENWSQVHEVSLGLS